MNSHPENEYHGAWSGDLTSWSLKSNFTQIPHRSIRDVVICVISVLGNSLTNCANPSVHQSYIAQCIVLQQKYAHVHISVTKWLWDICLIRCGMCEMGLIIRSVWSHNPSISALFGLTDCHTDTWKVTSVIRFIQIRSCKNSH